MGDWIPLQKFCALCMQFNTRLIQSQCRKTTNTLQKTLFLTRSPQVPQQWFYLLPVAKVTVLLNCCNIFSLKPFLEPTCISATIQIKSYPKSEFPESIKKLKVNNNDLSRSLGYWYKILNVWAFKNCLLFDKINPLSILYLCVF